MTKTIPVLIFESGTLEFIWYLACLREAPPCGTEAGAWNLVLPCGYALFAVPYALFLKCSFCCHIPSADLYSFSRLFTDALMMS